MTQSLVKMSVKILYSNCNQKLQDTQISRIQAAYSEISISLSLTEEMIPENELTKFFKNKACFSREELACYLHYKETTLAPNDTTHAFLIIAESTSGFETDSRRVHLFGMMFDRSEDNFDKHPRRGAVVARGTIYKLFEKNDTFAEISYLKTIAHEIGHIFNLDDYAKGNCISTPSDNKCGSISIMQISASINIPNNCCYEHLLKFSKADKEWMEFVISNKYLDYIIPGRKIFGCRPCNRQGSDTFTSLCKVYDKYTDLSQLTRSDDLNLLLNETTKITTTSSTVDSELHLEGDYYPYNQTFSFMSTQDSMVKVYLHHICGVSRVLPTSFERIENR